MNGRNTNKKGFTLIELLAVIVILCLLGALIIPKVSNTIRSSRSKSNKISVNGLVDVFNDMVMDKKANLIPFSGCDYDFGSLITNCGNMEFKGKLPDSGSLSIDSNGTVNGNVYYGDEKFIVSNNVVYADDEYRVPVGTQYAFDYTGDEQFFDAPNDGYYKLEVWGAQGGNINTGDEDYYGGYGGYSTGIIHLEKKDHLFINVGGAGIGYSGAGSRTGGYNGGGSIYVEISCSNTFGTGGGATHIASKSGVLSSFDSDGDGIGSSSEISDVLIVAGAGGGAGYRNCSSSDVNYSSGGSGGGYIGNSSETSSTWTYVLPIGGSQNSGGTGGTVNYESGSQSGSFGQGGIYSRTGGYLGQAGGGSGFYGGGLGMFEGGAGGSGYIGNTNILNGVMYCYNCSESSDSSTRTISTTDVFEDPVSNSAKIGNGFAKITYIGTRID